MLRRRSKRALCLVPVLLAGLSVVTLTAGEGFSHDDWTRVLERFVDERGHVDYLALASDREELDRYLVRIANSGPTSTPAQFPTRQAELAFYVNAYNALVFDGVLARGPEEESVWTGGLISGYSFFVGMKVTVDGTKTNLRKLENKTIRDRYEDPRIHAALNCASVGCPRLPREAFDPSRLDRQLDDAMRAFVSESRNVRVIESSRTVELSKIFDWFREDFLGYEKAQGVQSPGLIGYINRYRDAGSAIPEDYEIVFLEYDKRINKS